MISELKKSEQLNIVFAIPLFCTQMNFHLWQKSISQLN